MTARSPGLIVVLLWMLLPTGLPAQQPSEEQRGTLCIGRLVVPEGIPGPMDRHGTTTDTVFEIRVDKLPAVEVSHERGALFTGLDLGSSHLVAVRKDHETVESFRFRFKPEGPTKLCLWFKADYGYWSFMPDRRRVLCRCVATGKMPAQ